MKYVLSSRHVSLLRATHVPMTMTMLRSDASARGINATVFEEIFADLYTRGLLVAHGTRLPKRYIAKQGWRDVVLVEPTAKEVTEATASKEARKTAPKRLDAQPPRGQPGPPVETAFKGQPEAANTVPSATPEPAQPIPLFDTRMVNVDYLSRVLGELRRTVAFVESVIERANRDVPDSHSAPIFAPKDGLTFTQAIIHVLEQNRGVPLRPMQIARMLGSRPKIVSSTLGRIVETGRAKKVARGYYAALLALSERLNMKKIVITACFLVSCADNSPVTFDDDEQYSMCRVAGTYTIVEHRDSEQPGTCAVSGESEPFAMTIETRNGSTTLSLPILSGSCPAHVNGCEVTARCEIRDKSGNVAARADFTLRIDGDSVSGYEAGAFFPPNGAMKACTANFSLSGDRKLARSF